MEAVRPLGAIIIGHPDDRLDVTMHNMIVAQSGGISFDQQTRWRDVISIGTEIEPLNGNCRCIGKPFQPFDQGLMSEWIDKFIKVDERRPRPTIPMAVREIIICLYLTRVYRPRY